MSKMIHILQHSLGVDQYGRGEQYRNHFIIGEGSKDYPTCALAVALGLMTMRPGNDLTGGDDLFLVTPAGRKCMAENSPAPPPAPKFTRSQRRYRAYLEADWFVGNFRDWISHWKPSAQGAAA